MAASGPRKKPVPRASAHTDNSSPNPSTWSAHLLYAEHPAARVVGDDPIPERRTEVETVMQILRADEHIGVEEISHHMPIPRLFATSRNVAIFLNPRSRNASVKDDLPSNVLTTNARANRLPARALSVR